MTKKKKKKDKKTERVTSTFEWHMPNIQERTEEEKIKYNAKLLPLMQRIISGHITTILSNLKSEQGPNSDYILREFIKMSDTMLDYMDKVNKIMLSQYTFQKIKNHKN